MAGDTIRIETPLGSIRQVANITTAAKPGIVHAEAFWYYPEIPEADPHLHGVWDSNVNAIIPDDYDVCDFAGDHPFRGMRCRISKAQSAIDHQPPAFQGIDGW